MKIYDTLSKKKVELATLKDRNIGIYLCGPTVYDYGHLGHGRSAVVFDLMRRFLMYRGFRVTFVRNWTDIDDRTIERAAREGVSVRELTERFIEIYREDFASLNILEPDFAPKATDHIAHMLEHIEKLFEKGHAYILDDGVYFDVSTFPQYGSLSGQEKEGLRTGARVAPSDKKRNPGDFVLWKFEKPGEPSWESRWGKGRPGWHIECSAMSVLYLGETFDIHCGGQDLIFPHHEDEIAQARGAGYGFARYWMHNGFLNIDDEKMSKSLGNFFTLRQAFEKFNPLSVRFFLLQTHYRSPLSFSEDALRQADSARERYDNFLLRVSERASQQGHGKKNGRVAMLVKEATGGFEEGLDDDLNVSKSLASISDLVREVNRMIDERTLGSDDAGIVYDFMKGVDSVLGVFTFERELLPADIERLIEERNRAREKKEYERADSIRQQLADRGILLEDTKQGTRWKKI